ncbi:hypothetical protein FSP39_001116 [Pinctada imbricata]|uniref:BRCT domain-containing protein n=1 Tax=Pinctada imbricata TaxID=66713 RepID=A0AA88XWG2_PINIB|nr:hypothetical protein FSP39_001116 [Pinctada imbricata]
MYFRNLRKLVTMASLKTRFQATIEGAGSRVFLLSGLEDEKREDLAVKIRELGGVYVESEAFRPHCTHIICGKVTRSEKFLGGCATGRWVLHPEYVTVSSEKGGWEAEENYEWANYATPDNKQMVDSARRWRFHAEVYQTLAFSDWKTAVVVPGNKKSIIYKRLLISGGAEVYNLKLPVKNPGKVMNLLTFVFVSERLAVQVCDLMEYGILCLRPEYIGDYLVKVHTFVYTRS